MLTASSPLDSALERMKHGRIPADQIEESAAPLLSPHEDTDFPLTPTDDNLAIVEAYAGTWNSQLPRDDKASHSPLPSQVQSDASISAGRDLRWPFLDDDDAGVSHDLSEPGPPLFASTSRARPRICHRIDESLEDNAALHHHALGTVYESEDVDHISPPGSRNTKVMTAAQFRAYVQDKQRKDHLAFFYQEDQEDQSEEEDNVEPNVEEDAITVSRRLREQRKQQEAHITNYRKQRMKTIGSNPVSAPPPPPFEDIFASKQSPMSHFTTPWVSEQNASDDTDDVPLALLQYQKPLRERDQHHPISRSASIATQKPAPPLQDPFLQPMPTNRQVSSSQLPPDPFAMDSPNMWPFCDQKPFQARGLVSMIAHEERSMALRRANANSNAGSNASRPIFMPEPIRQLPLPTMDMFDASSLRQMNQAPLFYGMQPELPRFIPHMPQAPMMPRSHMMQPQPPPLPYWPRPAQLPMMPPYGYGMPAYSHGPGSDYSPSVAPLERSNVGLPSRYRSVSKATDYQHGREHSLTNIVEEDAAAVEKEEKMQRRRAIWVGH